MSSQLKLRRGSTVSHAGFTGADGEVTFDTDKNCLVTHDNETAGGFPHTKAADLAASSGASLVGYMPTGSGASPVTVERKLREGVSVMDFGASGNGIANDSEAIQKAVNFANLNQVPLYFPSGTYKVLTPVNLPGKVNLNGTAGFNNSVLVGYAASIFSYATLDDSVFEGLTFQAAVAGVSAFRQTTLSNYTSNTVWKNCTFFYSLTECIYANLILCTIDANNFGYYGPSSPSQITHRHIYCKGDITTGNISNINRILNNRFYNASAGESCYFESGTRLQIWSNDFETNKSRAITINGMGSFDIRDNWFENNDNQFAIQIANNSEGSIGNYVGVIDDNFFTTQFNGGYIADISGSSVINSFSHNFGSGTWYQITPGNSRINDAKGNRFLGTMALPSHATAGVDGFSLRGATGDVLSSISGDVSHIALNIGSPTAEKIRFTSSGKILIGTTDYVAGTNSVQIGSIARAFSTSSAETTNQIFFDNPNGSVGSIQTSGMTTSYGTSSDYRLKNITGKLHGSGDYIDSLNPVCGTWKADGSTFIGLIAHEVQEASKTQVATGVKDGECMQGMDYSSPEIIANMIAELKSLRSRVASMEDVASKLCI